MKTDPTSGNTFRPTVDAIPAKLRPVVLTAACLCGAVSPVLAGTEDAGSASITETPKPESRTTLSGWIDGGITLTQDTPSSRTNFGNYTNDRPNEPMLNQVVLTLERPLDPEAQDFDWGFKAQFLYGTDGRYYHNTGELDLVTSSIMQPAFTEVYLNLHLPVLTEGGMDLKIGQFPTIEGVEGVPAPVNIFYSHSYIYQFAVPAYNLGFMSTLHVNKHLDLYGGVNRGLGIGFVDNNDSVNFEGGVGVKFLDGDLTALLSTNIGPQNADNNSDFRYINDLQIWWKISDKLQSITDISFNHDEVGGGAQCYGIAQYLNYTVNDWLSAGIRTEVFRDDDGFYVAQFGGNNDFAHFLRGDNFTPDADTYGGGETTYGAITIGLNLKPAVPDSLGFFKGITIRPEVRLDSSLNDTTPFVDGTKDYQLTFACDAILTF